MTDELDTVKDKSVEELLKTPGVKGLHDKVMPQVKSFEDTRLKLIKSLRILTKACEAAKENLDVVKGDMGYDAVDEDLSIITAASLKLVAALEQQEKVEKMQEQKPETKTTTAAVKLDKIEAQNSLASTGTGLASNGSSQTL